MKTFLKGMFGIMGVILCLGGAYMMVYGGLKGILKIQVGGTIMYASSLPLFFQLNISRLEERLKKIEKLLSAEK